MLTTQGPQGVLLEDALAQFLRLVHLVIFNPVAKLIGNGPSIGRLDLLVVLVHKGQLKVELAIKIVDAGRQVTDFQAVGQSQQIVKIGKPDAVVVLVIPVVVIAVIGIQV